MGRIVLLESVQQFRSRVLATGGVAAAEDPDQIVESPLAEAREAQARGDFSQAAAAISQGRRRGALRSRALGESRPMENEAGKISEAMKSFQHAARLKPSLFVPQLLLGMEYLQSNQAETALPYLENAVRLNPNDFQAVRTLGKAHAMLGHSESATELYPERSSSAPYWGDAWLDLGTTYLQKWRTTHPDDVELP